MPRRLLGVFILLLVSVSAMQAQGDVALLTIGNEKVDKEEFEYYWSKSSEKNVRVFAQTLGHFMQKIQWAKELGLDTLSAYREQISYYRQILEHRSEMLSQQRYRRGVEEEWVKLQHVTCLLRQHEDKRKENEAKAYLDSLYVSLDEDVEGMFETFPWVQTRHLLKEWQDQLKTLSRGEFSKPFYSSQGIHIIAWADKIKECSTGKMMQGRDLYFQLKELEGGLLVASLDTYLERTLVCSDLDLE